VCYSLSVGSLQYKECPLWQAKTPMQWRVTSEEEGTDDRFGNMRSERRHYENSVKEGK